MNMVRERVEMETYLIQKPKIKENKRGFVIYI